MASEIPTLEVEARDQTGTSASRKIRAEDAIPGVCYGSGTDSFPVQLDPEALRDVLDEGHGRNTVFAVETNDGRGFDYVLLRDFQFDPVKRTLTHVDLFVVEPDRNITVEVPVEPYGEAEGVRAGGRLQLLRPEVPVRCTPKTIPDTIEVDVSELGPEDAISASDLEYPEGVEPGFETDYAVVRIMMPRTGVVGLEPEGPEAEEEEEAEEVEGEEVEGEEAEEAEEGEDEGPGGGASAPGAPEF